MAYLRLLSSQLVRTIERRFGVGEKKEVDDLINEMVVGYSSCMSSLLSLVNKLQSEIEQLKFDISVIRADYELCRKPSSGMTMQDPCLNDSSR